MYRKIYPPILHVNLNLVYQQLSPLLGSNTHSMLFTNTHPLLYPFVRPPPQKSEKFSKTSHPHLIQPPVHTSKQLHFAIHELSIQAHAFIILYV